LRRRSRDDVLKTTFSKRRSQDDLFKTTFSRRRFNAILSDNVNQLVCFIKFFNQSSRELTILVYKNLDFLCRLCAVSVSSLCRHCVVIMSSQCHLIVVSVSSLSFLCRLENVVSRTSSQERRLKQNVVSNVVSRTYLQNIYVEYMCRILYKVWFITLNYHAQIIYTKSLYIYYIYIYTTFIYTLHLYIYYTIFSVEKCRDGLGFPKKIPTRLYFLQSRNTSLWYTSKIGSRQNLLSRLDFTNSLNFFIKFFFAL
jgi:hypothetical protein